MLSVICDNNTCTAFAFSASSITSQQFNSISEAGTFYSDGTGSIDITRLSSSLLQSMSSMSVSMIMKYNCPARYTPSREVNITPTVKSESPKVSSLQPQSFYIKFGDRESYNLSDGTSVSASLTSMGLGDLTLKISWTGKTPTKLSWQFDGYGMTPTSNTIYSKKNGNSYSLSEWVLFEWASTDPSINGVNFTIYPITEEERKYER